MGLLLANQYFHQLEPEIRHAVLGNAATLISFRVGHEDAAILSREFQPRIGVEDLLNLANHHIYLKLMIDGAPSQVFSAIVDAGAAQRAEKGAYRTRQYSHA